MLNKLLENTTNQFQSNPAQQVLENVKTLTAEIQELYLSDEIPWCVGYSGGKDSTTVAQLIWNAIAELPSKKRKKTVHIMTTDTQVENPIVSSWVRHSLKKMKSAAVQQGMPIEPHLLQPDTKDTFWVSLMGKGYPAPRHGFRWCTERLKIRPSNHFIREMIRDNGEVFLILGTRKSESTTRAATMTKHEISLVSDRLKSNPDNSKSHNSLSYSGSLPNALVYSPIQNWRTDEVWLYLMQWENPWEGNNKDLFAMYRGATADNECPLVVDTSTPSCGDSRFGCWVCTMVSKDKSMEAMIQNDQEKEWLQPLLNIRNELDIENDWDKRDFRRLYGKVELFERNVDGKTSIQPIPGPYTKYWREHWLRKVLQAQVEVRKNAPEDMQDITLITQEELSEIRRIWLEEKHEFDDSLPKIYQEVTGETFQDIRPGVNNSLLGSDEWDVLAEICGEDSMHLELMSRLLDTERQFYTKTYRVGIYTTLEKCFDTSSRSQAEAIENAHRKRNLKTAAGEGNVEQLKQNLPDAFSQKDDQKNKQLTWAEIKFSAKQTDNQD